MFFKLRLRKGMAYLLIWLQLLTPGLSLLPVMARASESAEMQDTLQGLNSLILGEDTPMVVAPTPPQPAVPDLINKPATTTSSVSDYFHVQTPTVTSTQSTGLPALSSSTEVSTDSKTGSPNQDTLRSDGENRLASGAIQAGTLFSGEQKSEAAINYARSIGEGLINQQVNDWLNQYGNAKVSLGTQQNLSGDLLVPFYETDKSLVFSQLGARTHQDRNTVNLGVGYRQYQDDWMLGVNTFYDYDYTGKNKRFGIGTEAWTDYLKLAANGYIRQTNWHQSTLGNMADFDERPANGFDVRANAYLPSWPNVGGSLKYEQYFGKGVSVAESANPDSLKDDPVVVTAGVDYTPFPLVTLSAKHAMGDSNETSMGVDFTYRFGVPWSQQVDPDSVGLMRSLAGSRYDFVDRNYNIVMQYRKQELLTISLPVNTTAQAADTVPIVLTVARTKYGLKSVEWSVDPLLMARGGSYKESLTELQVTLPAYVFGQKQNATQNYKISAIATDNNGNLSNTAETLIGVVPSDNVVGNLTLSPSDRILPANDNDLYTLTGVVTDGKGAPLANQQVTFSVGGLINASGQHGTTLAPAGGGASDARQLKVTTGLDGKAVVTLRSSVAGEGQITATMDNGNASTTKVTFVGDSASAQVSTVTLTDSVVRKAANGTNTFTYTVRVKDSNGNLVLGTEVTADANKPGVTVTVSGPTDTEGQATITLTSTTTAVAEIRISARVGSTASVNADKTVSFVGDDTTAVITAGNLT
ncbi:inverse autotransporter beta domain-containing protein, partial [Yersinia pekkanenii]